MQTFEFDTVVVGSGLAGLSAAYHASKYGSVAIITKSQLDVSNSYYAQGGIAAAISDDDSPEAHAQDTIEAGRGLCDHDAVQILVYEGKQRVLELIEMGMPFDRENGQLVLGLEGGHHARRILHADGDATGKALTCFKLKLVKAQKNIHTFEYVAALRILHNHNQVQGIQALDFTTGKNLVFRTKAVIMATGGLSRMYTRSTNPHTATGDGIAIAYEAGACIADMEFIQFHPSALYLPNQDAYLISEAVRGEGAWLLNEKGERFMKDIHPLAELAPRDVVAFNIYKQIKASKQKTVFLSLKHLNAKKIKNRFKNIFEHLMGLGYDLTQDLIPIAPAAHYMVGGVRCDLNGETSISGLFTCGELASTGVMGANRLASNSLLECLVFGKRASDKAASIQRSPLRTENITPISLDPQNESLFVDRRNKIAHLMSENLGIVRNAHLLQKAIREFEAIENEFDSPEEYNLLKIKQTAITARLIAQSALIREESRGGHIREDFPQEAPTFEKHIIQKKNRKPQFEPVRK